MPFDPLALVRPNILAMQAYSSARSEFKGSAQVFLDANENPYPTPYNRYPDPLQEQLKQRLGVLKGIAAEHIFVGNGSDEPIDLLLRIFCQPGQDAIVTTPPTYGMYAVSAATNDIRLLEAPLTADFQLDVNAVLTQAREAKLIFLCSPNNPTGNLLRPADVLQVVQHAHCLVVVDEAYIDFAPGASLLPQLAAHPNLVVLHTLSKAWGLAGLRLGMAFASSSIIQLMNKVKPPYNISSLTQQVVLDALQHTNKLSTQLDELLHERARVLQALATSATVQQAYPTDANFVLVRCHSHQALYRHLLAHGIVVRDRSSQAGCAGCLRISIGTPAENGVLLQALATFVPTTTPV